jgi:hypothetical protein
MIFILYRKKEQLNIQLYLAHLQAANTWGPLRDTIQQTQYNSINIHMERKHHCMHGKFHKLNNQHTNGGGGEERKKGKGKGHPITGHTGPTGGVEV